MSQEHFWVLLSKKLSGNANPEELSHLETLIQEHPEWQFAIQNLTDLWKQEAGKDSLQADDAYLLHLHRMTEMNIEFSDELPGYSIPSPSSTKKKWYWAAAATLLLTLSLFGFNTLFNGKKGEPTLAVKEINEISTRKGSKTEIRLPDSSVVWLNAGSKLTYNKDYGQSKREVTLTGEGYFDIRKMTDKPFLIHTNNITIKVLGTTFNVKAYPEDKTTETSLIKGSIEVTIKNRPNNKIILSPNEKLVVENESVIKEKKSNGKTVPPAIAINKLKLSPVDNSIAETQWVKNKLVFNDESFAEVAVRMERWYDVEIELKDELLEQMRMTGNFEKETIGQALEALSLMTPFKHDQTGNKIIIHH